MADPQTQSDPLLSTSLSAPLMAPATPTTPTAPVKTILPGQTATPGTATKIQQAQPEQQAQDNFKKQLSDINAQAEKIKSALDKMASPDGTISDTSKVMETAGGFDTTTKAQKALQDLETTLKQHIDSLSPANQGQNFQNYYNQLAQEQGLPALDEKVVNLQNVINGTEQDIRNEIQAGGGIATESQIQALVATRNKVLMSQLNSLNNLRQYKQDWVNNQMQLYETDAKTASDNFDKLFGYQQTVTQLQNTIDNSGFKNTLAYQTFQQKEQAAGLKMMDTLNKQGALGNLDPDTLKWLSDSTGIPENLITKAGENASAAMALKIKTLNDKLSTNGGFGGVNNMAEAVMHGLLAPSQLPGFGVKSLRTQVLNRVYELNPNFDTRNADSSFAFQKSQKSNLIQASINSANYAAQQIIDLSDKVDRTDIQPINAAELLFKSKSGDVNTAKFLSAVKIVGDEYGAVFGQGAATDFKAQLGLQVVDPTFSKAQFKAVVQDTVINLMKARLKAIQEQGTGAGVVPDINNPATSNPTPSAQDQSYIQSLGL